MSLDTYRIRSHASKPFSEAEFLPTQIRKSDLREINSGSLVRWAVAGVAVGVAVSVLGAAMGETVSVGVGAALVAIGILVYVNHRITVREAIIRARGVWRGECPYCSDVLVLSRDQSAADCPHCHNPVLRTEDRFYRAPVALI